MTYLNNELQVRKELTERINKLQTLLDEEKANSQKLVSAVTQYAESKAKAEQKYNNLSDAINIISSQLPTRYRRQIANLLQTP